jgi:hypothetical protein
VKLRVRPACFPFLERAGRFWVFSIHLYLALSAPFVVILEPSVADWHPFKLFPLSFKQIAKPFNNLPTPKTLSSIQHRTTTQG